MPWLFKRRVRIAPGLTLNLGKRAMSISVGRRGIHYTTGSRGSRITVGLPGTGLYNTTRLTGTHQIAARRRSPPISLARVHLPGTGFWAFLIPGPSIEKMVAAIKDKRGEIRALDDVGDRAVRLERSDATFVAFWTSARADFSAVLHAKPPSKDAVGAVIEAYRDLFNDLLASVRHTRELEHDAHLGEHGARPLQSAADAFIQTLHAADDFMKRLLEPVEDAQVLDRDMRYGIESLRTRHETFAHAMLGADPNYAPEVPTPTFDF